MIHALLISAGLLGGAVQVDSARVQSAAGAGSAVEPADTAARLLHVQTFADLGFQDGVALTRPPETTTIYMRGAPGLPVSDGVLRLDVSQSLQDFAYAFLEVLVHGVPRQTVDLTSLDTTTFTIELPLEPSELDHAFVPVSFRYGGRVRDDLCFDPRLNGSFVRVHDSSGLWFDYPPAAVNTIATAWALLPARVIVGVPADADRPDLYQAAWQIGSILTRKHHDVQFVGIRDAQQLERLLNGGPAVQAGTSADSVRPGMILVADDSVLRRIAPASAGSQNLRMRVIDGRPVVLVGGRIPGPAARLLAEPWRQVAQAANLDVIDAKPLRDNDGEPGTVTFRELGIESAPVRVSDHAEWSFPFSVRDFEPDHLPSRAVLDVSVGLSTVEEPGVMNVYLNDALIHSARVGRSSEPLALEMALPRKLLRIDNTLRVELLRQLWSNAPATVTGACRELPPPIPVQFMETSRIESKTVRGATDFVGLPAKLRSGFRAFLPAAFLATPEASLPLLSRLGADVLPMTALAEVLFYGPGEKRETGKHFVVVGDGSGFNLQAPAAITDTTVTVFDSRRRRHMEIAGKPDVTVLQVARSDGGTGLWARPLHGPPYEVSKRPIELSRGDVAFVGGRGTDLMFDSREVQRERGRRLAELADGYEYFIAGLVLLLLGILLVLWIRRRRSQDSVRRPTDEARPEDEEQMRRSA